MQLSLVSLMFLAGCGLALPADVAPGQLLKRGPTYPLAPRGMHYEQQSGQRVLKGDGPGDFIYYAYLFEVCNPDTGGDGTECFIESNNFRNCKAIKGAKKDGWEQNTRMENGHPRPDQLSGQFATHSFGRCQQSIVHFYRQPDGSFRAESEDGVGVARCFGPDHSDTTLGWDLQCPAPFSSSIFEKILRCSGNVCL